MSDIEIRRAIELLGRHGYQVWKDDGKIVTEADREREAENRRQREEMRRVLDEQAKRPTLKRAGSFRGFEPGDLTPDGRYLLPRKLRHT